ncbi:AAA family ATPase [Bacillus mangrovi]|uniref:AAA family ATPase n=1 Tax=Metabacillus mangrovi TaxID=1491830 RepID=A0A7X2S3J0_9BACI|nr:UvrD-helicase domain-containing protein [Metabacillus mangrovi]MTH53028.1 AAA family ATPase [Metabacillus mangrovi]
MANSNQSAFQFELQQLKKFAAEIQKQKEGLEAVPPYRGEDLAEQALEASRERSRRNLDVSEKEPYFGRLDFRESGDEEPVPLYIGKAGVSESESGHAMIMDWRAPAASLFYSYSGGEEEAWYMAPEGMVEGEIYLKRNVAVRNGTLQRVVDTYSKGSSQSGAADEFLLYRLGEKKDNRLKDIVSTIQAEQNEMIRAPRDTALIIQGAAGSGKTTVALHRLAYLIYEYRENMLAEHMIIFAPNTMFLDYISNVLPELGVGHIKQTTFAEWAAARLGGVLTFKPRNWEKWFVPGPFRSAQETDAPWKLKGSISFMQAIEEALIHYTEDLLPSADFSPWQGKVLKNETIRNWFNDEFTGYAPVKKKELTAEKIKRWIKTELDKEWDKKARQDNKKSAAQKLRAYLKTWRSLEEADVYAEMLKVSEVRAVLTDEVADAALAMLKKREADHEDLAPLVHIRIVLNGLQRGERFHHIVIDEAQDFSPYEMAVLQKLALKNSFTILGDLAQGIYAGIRSWEEIFPIFKEGRYEYKILSKSYRSTMEIIEFANSILLSAFVPPAPAVPVFRSGEPAEAVHVPASEKEPYILKWVEKERSKKTESLAIICRTESDAEKLWTGLKSQIGSLSLVRDGQRGYSGGVTIIPVYLAKGLEFDAVLIVDADAENYQLNQADAKLLYVGCTRALHTLAAVYSGTPSPLLKKEEGKGK